MMDPVVTTVIAVIVAPAIMSGVTYILQRSTKREEWRRQDEVADRVAEAARLLKASTDSTASSFVDLKAGQKQIHTLVNSKMTEEMEARKDAIERELVGLHELVSLKEKLNVPPNPRTLAAIETAESSLKALTEQLKDRQIATVKADREKLKAEG